MRYRFAHDIPDDFGLHVELYAPIVDARYRKQVLYQADEPARIFVDVFVHALFLRLAQARALGKQHIGIARDARKRRAQIVRDHPQKVRPELFLFGLRTHFVALARRIDLLACLSALVE